MKASNTVLAYLKGGLGNQLFIYAANRALALRCNADLVLDRVSGFQFDKRYQRSCELDAFALGDGVVCSDHVDPWYRLRRKLYEKSGFARQLLSSRYWTDHEQCGVDLAVPQQLSGLIRTNGQWTDECYFREITGVLHQELRITKPLHPRNESLAVEIANCNSVAIHVRRVAYASILEMSYYESAMNQMRALYPTAVFYCFSDDVDWCRQNLDVDGAMQFVENSDLPAIEDFQLMSRCRHFIIANSTFSWWAAWLGLYPDKKVFAPAIDTYAASWAKPSEDWEQIWVGSEGK